MEDTKLAKGSRRSSLRQKAGKATKSFRRWSVAVIRGKDKTLIRENSLRKRKFPFRRKKKRKHGLDTIDETDRRLSYAVGCLSLSDQPLPDGAQDSVILNDEQIGQVTSIIPARAELDAWKLIYSTMEHGFSLQTLYRRMGEWPDDLSPSLLVIETTSGSIFGAIISCPLRQSEHFYGTGESLLFTFQPEFECYQWSGENGYFACGDDSSLVIGSGDSGNGIWLDGDLNKGISQKCDTFQNEPLAGDEEDFIIAKLEIFGFCNTP